MSFLIFSLRGLAAEKTGRCLSSSSCPIQKMSFSYQNPVTTETEGKDRESFPNLQAETACPSAYPGPAGRLPSGKRVQRYALMRNGQTKQGTFFKENQGGQENTLSHRTIHGGNHSKKRRKGGKRTHLLYYIYARKTKGTGIEGNGYSHGRTESGTKGMGKGRNRQETFILSRQSTNHRHPPILVQYTNEYSTLGL